MAPFHGFLDVGHDCMDALANLLEDRPGERLRLCDIRVDAWLALQIRPPPSISLTTPTTITSRLRFRPAVPREIMPTPAPMIASGTISQFAQPSSGMKATIAQMSATKPMISETRLNIVSFLTSFGRLRQPRRA